MPTLETPDGKPVDADAINAQFSQTMNSDATVEMPPPRRPKAESEPDAEQPKARRGRPPKGEQARTAAAPAAEITPEVTAKRAASAEETFRLAGMGLLLVGKTTGMKAFTADGFIVNANAAPLAAALADVAAVEPQIARWLDKAPSAKVTAWMGLASVVGGLALQAGANHGLIKPGMMGTSDPADIIRVNEEAIARQQQLLEEEAAEMARLAEQAEAQNEPAAA